MHWDLFHRITAYAKIVKTRAKVTLHREWQRVQRQEINTINAPPKTRYKVFAGVVSYRTHHLNSGMVNEIYALNLRSSKSTIDDDGRPIRFLGTSFYLLSREETDKTAKRNMPPSLVMFADECPFQSCIHHRGFLHQTTAKDTRHNWKYILI